MPSRFFLFVVSGLLLLPLAAGVQSPQPVRPQETIKVMTSLVLLDAQVLNKKTLGTIDNLTADDFLVYEDNVMQKITNFSRDKLPLSVVLLFDVTWSLHPVLKQLASGAERALRHLKPDDEVAVMAFSDSASVIDEFTVDRQRTVAGIMNACANKASLRHPAFLNEGVYQAVAHSMEASRSGSRRVVVILNDGAANIPLGKIHSEKEALHRVLESGVTICGLVARSIRTVVVEMELRTLPQLILASKLRHPGSVYTYAKQTGGEVIKTPQQEADVRLAEMFDHLRRRYTLGYVSSNPKLDGKYRTIKVKLKPEIVTREGNPIAVFAKQGYYAVAQVTP